MIVWDIGFTFNYVTSVVIGSCSLVWFRGCKVMGVPAIFFSDLRPCHPAHTYLSVCMPTYCLQHLMKLLIATLIPAISSAFVPNAMISVASRSTVSTELAVTTGPTGNAAALILRKEKRRS
eukprot:scaffold25942_cov123-Skeletonema_dohrnii-CCMP3373.AAC.3